MHGMKLKDARRYKREKRSDKAGEELRAWIGRAITETAQRDEYARLLKR